jgi:hypothetical protein
VSFDFSGRQYGDKYERTASEEFAVYAALPDPQKRSICVDLLAEFGVHQFNETRKGELQHTCSLPLGGHTDRNSVTASINYKKLTFKCFVCSNKGGLLWWIATNRGESVEQSYEWLQKASGITDGIDLPKFLEILDALFHPRSETKQMPTFDERTLDQWLDWPAHHPYLTEPVWFSQGSNVGGREIPAENLQRFKVGFCYEDVHWKYYQRVIIPMWWNGSLVAWQARQIPQGWRAMLDPSDRPDPQEAKFKFSPDAPGDRIYFGTDEALSGRELLVVESPISVLRHAHHLPVAATMGAGISDFQLPFLHRFDRVTMWLDNDNAGWNAMTGTGTGKWHTPGLIEKLRDYVEVRIVDSPWWKADIADLTETEAVDLYKSAKPAVLWRRPDVRKLQWYDRHGKAA